MKKISFLIPTFNEEGNVEILSKEIIRNIEILNNYDFEIVFIDYCSSDETSNKIINLCL